MKDAVPIACTLSTDDYAERLAEITELGGEALLGIEQRPDGAVLSFRNTPQIRDRLDSIIQAEGACCSFLAMSLESHGSELLLSIAAPLEAMPVVRQLTESFTTA